MDDFFVIGKFIASMIAHERPIRILEISGGGSRYGCIMKACQEVCGITDGVVDRLAMSAPAALSGGTVYSKILNEEYLDNCSSLDKYDFVLISEIPEHIEPAKIRALLDTLQYKITKQVMIITPLDSDAEYRKYHPVVFIGLDFSYSLIPGTSKAMQVYNVFPKLKYAPTHIDLIPTTEIIETLNVAFVLPHHALTGGMKALLQQIQHLSRKGHNINIYFRSDVAKSAIPPWSVLTENDYAKQTIIPRSKRFLDFIKDVDIIIIGGIDQAPEFLASKIPVVLWEQGSEAIFGEFGKALYSSSIERLGLRSLYRLPIHLLAVSNVISTVLKGIYGRDAFVYPNGIDTEFYHPAEKHNDLPVVLLTGHPALAFKGFRFAFRALSRAYEDGLRFRVKWAAQVKVIHGATNFPLEVTVSPTQQELAHMYRSADVFLSPSLYESYALPPLEAMASGTAVIATDCGGIQTYAKHGENCILCRQEDSSAVISALSILLNNQFERQRMERAGRETALEHSAGIVIEMLERRLFSIVQHHRLSSNELLLN